ncbi:hypothetical protein [Actinocorallia aurantiaca]|uniref:Uncharacterized protein n=1 Tax=Actinocorallia aurantiaca TaxID=46204 RepID=A0ABN3U616_9ACTN
MLTPLRATSARSALLTLALVAGSFAAFSAPAHAGPCEVAGTLGCGAEGQAPGNPGGPGGPNNDNGPGDGGGNNNGPGDGPSQVDNGGLEDEVPDPPAPAVPNTEDTVAQARDQIEFPVPTIEVAPEPKTYVRVKTSFWIPEDQTEDLVVSASVGAAEGVLPQTITATAEFLGIDWNFVEGKKFCDAPIRINGEGEGNECDYYFKTSSAYHGMEAFTIEAFPVWKISWTCAGTCPGNEGVGEPVILEDEYLSPAGELELVVDEIQTEANDN